ncbi:tRNA dihydrouridine(20/20a) synthase DusA [Enterobacteriaceae endosymbiont of Donacia tomentosa]|uniref:tRNA dihydrouridine(20/20a) synthase DusA n=1 Tax=Enterobacteriaceae endosymbiont of Donacia tomentosa TaxID=2675787 RepID=UPI0014490DE3|nr:tRNA dihydrouridine(20/20a) synthase DusA [Enterobacteriaceae endosymbiont of Donacia tomentosa]QJC31496.1 tRNA dihydrouridine(20/20a) synthase DusA [Enterobacteriaceae endosymbiont of Donacia tomentosa]
MKKDDNIPYFRFEVAPMLKKTNRYCRYFYRKLTKKALLYTEMIHSNVIKNNKNILLKNNNVKNVVLQLAGNEPKLLSSCAKQAEKIGYKEINFNLGCPSLKSQKGHFGAYLMNQPLIVSDCIKAMSDSVTIPITVKMRTGTDHNNNDIFLYNLINLLSDSGCKRFIIHARKALLAPNINVKNNLIIPKLDYNLVYKIKKEFPNIKISINGGIKTLSDIKNHLKYVDGVMLGRQIFKNPRFLIKIDQFLFKNKSVVQNPIIIVKSIFPYIKKELNKGIPLKIITAPILNFFHGMNGSNNFKKFISNKNNYLNLNSLEVLNKALSYIKIK